MESPPDAATILIAKTGNRPIDSAITFRGVGASSLAQIPKFGIVLVLVVVLENPDRFAIRLTEQISSIGLFAVTESQCTEDEDDDEDDSSIFGI